MTSLTHLLCSPFPSPQGTQACIASMLRAERDAGRAPKILTFEERYGPAPQGLSIERMPSGPLRIGARSGPSIARVAQDLRAIPWLPRRGGDGLLAHNVESACVSALARVPFVYVAHTSMQDELPTYGRCPVGAAHAGDLLDRSAIARADGVCAVAPALAASLARRTGREVAYLPIPWPLATPESTPRAARDRVRASLGIDDATAVVLHAGNLDAYQGLETVSEVIRAMNARAPTVWLVATESDAAEFRAAFDGVPIRFARLASEADRRAAHAAADVVVLARHAPGGLPVKLLDALARGVPVVATRTSCAGLALGEAAEIAADMDISALTLRALAGTRAGLDPAMRERRAGAGRAYLTANHSDDGYLLALDGIATRLGDRARR